MPTQNGESTESQIFDIAMGNSGPTVLEEYQLKVEEQTRELNNLNLQVKSLQTDNQQLIEQSTRDTRTLEDKEVEIERMKRMNTKIQKELADLKVEQRRQQQELSKRSAAPPVPGGLKKGISAKAEEKSFDIQLNPLDNLNSFAGGRARGGQSVYHKRPMRKLGSLEDPQHWLSSDLEEKVRNFDEIRQNFINNLTNQMSNLLVTDQPVQRSQTVYSKAKVPLGDSPDLRVETTLDDKITEKDEEMEDASEQMEPQIEQQ